MPDNDSYEALSPPKFIAAHWPKMTPEELINDFLDFVADSENGGAELRHRVNQPGDQIGGVWVWEEAPRPELIESYLAAADLT